MQVSLELKSSGKDSDISSGQLTEPVTPESKPVRSMSLREGFLFSYTKCLLVFCFFPKVIL